QAVKPPQVLARMPLAAAKVTACQVSARLAPRRPPPPRAAGNPSPGAARQHGRLSQARLPASKSLTTFPHRSVRLQGAGGPLFSELRDGSVKQCILGVERRRARGARRRILGGTPAPSEPVRDGHVTAREGRPGPGAAGGNRARLLADLRAR